MKIKLLMVLVSFTVMAVTAYGQQDPLDAGGPDSMVMVISQPDVLADDSTVIAELYFVNDVQDLSSASVGFDWDNPKLVMDTAYFSPEALAAFTAVQVVYYKGDRDSANAYQWFQFSGAAVFNTLAASATRQLVATYEFHVENWDINDSAVIDTNTFSSGVNLKFVDPALNQYRPTWPFPVVGKDVSGITVLNRSNLPKEFAVSQNYPNPFNPITTVLFDVPVRTRVNLTIFNVLGQKVTTLVDEELAPNSYEIEWNSTTDSGNRAASGIYFYRLSAGDFVKTKKMMLLK